MGGYIEGGIYHYYLQDHLGLGAAAAVVEDTNNYSKKELKKSKENPQDNSKNTNSNEMFYIKRIEKEKILINPLINQLNEIDKKR